MRGYKARWGYHYLSILPLILRSCVNEWMVDHQCGMYVIHDQVMTCSSTVSSMVLNFLCGNMREGGTSQFEWPAQKEILRNRPFEGGTPPWEFLWLIITTCHLILSNLNHYLLQPPSLRMKSTFFNLGRGFKPTTYKTKAHDCSARLLNSQGRLHEYLLSHVFAAIWQVLWVDLIASKATNQNKRKYFIYFLASAGFWALDLTEFYAFAMTTDILLGRTIL